MYVKYVSQSMGVKIPSLAAGDDVVAWVRKSDLDWFLTEFKMLSTPDKNYPGWYGLG